MKLFFYPKTILQHFHKKSPILTFLIQISDIFEFKIDMNLLDFSL